MFWMYFSFAGVVVGDPVAVFGSGVVGVIVMFWMHFLESLVMFWMRF